MVEIESVSAIEHTNIYRISLKSVTWVTLAIIAIMTFLFPITGLQTSFGSFASDMYFHSIGIGIAALASCVMLAVFKLDKHEPPIDFPIHYRAFIAVIIGAIAALIIGFSALNKALPDVGIALLIIALVLIADVGAALFIEMLELPRKLNGTFNRNRNYFSLMIPTSKNDWSSYKKMNIGYWLALFAVGSTIIAGILGFMNLWVTLFGASFFSGYISWLGGGGSFLGHYSLTGGADGFLDMTLDPHSHMMALAIMAGVVAIVAEQYHVLETKDWRKTVARIGLWVSIIGVVAMTIVLADCGFNNFQPPTLLPSAGGVNGLAGDDATMAIIGIGALIAIIPLALTEFEDGKKSWTDPVRLAILGTWVVALILNIIQGFWIEFNETSFSQDIPGKLAANDVVFSNLQPMYGIFVLTALAILLIAADYYTVVGTVRDIIGILAWIGLIVSAVGVTLWVFVDPKTNSIWSDVYALGIWILILSAIITVIVIITTNTSHLKRSISEQLDEKVTTIAD